MTPISQMPVTTSETSEVGPVPAERVVGIRVVRRGDLATPLEKGVFSYPKRNPVFYLNQGIIILLFDAEMN